MQKSRLLNFKNFSILTVYHIYNSKKKRVNSIDPDDVADYESSHLDLCCFANSAVFDAVKSLYRGYLTFSV